MDSANAKLIACFVQPNIFLGLKFLQLPFTALITLFLKTVFQNWTAW
jgi:hypothetical protein